MKESLFDNRDEVAERLDEGVEKDGHMVCHLASFQTLSRDCTWGSVLGKSRTDGVFGKDRMGFSASTGVFCVRAFSSYVL